MKFTKMELMELALSVRACFEDGENTKEFDEDMSDIFNYFSNRYEVTEYGAEQERKHSRDLLKKLIEAIKEE